MRWFRGLLRWRCLTALAITFLCALAPATFAQSRINPLKPVDTSSPRATIQSFLDLIDVIERDYLAYYDNQSAITERIAQRNASKLIRLLDLSKTPPAARDDVAADVIAFLVDIFKRLELPPLQEIPGPEAVQTDPPIASWRVPGTEITIVRIVDGPRTGDYQFDSTTVARAGEFYELIRAFPIQAQIGCRKLAHDRAATSRLDDSARICRSHPRAAEKTYLRYCGLENFGRIWGCSRRRLLNSVVATGYDLTPRQAGCRTLNASLVHVSRYNCDFILGQLFH